MRNRDKRRAEQHYKSTQMAVDHAQKIAYDHVCEWYAQDVHVCPTEVVSVISHKDSKGHYNGYMYTQCNHIGGGMFLRNSAPEFRTWQASLDDQQGKRVHQKYYK